jgi:outer membrane protein OmpA-like peptidoglycan-associated protein
LPHPGQPPATQGRPAQPPAAGQPPATQAQPQAPGAPGASPPPGAQGRPPASATPAPGTPGQPAAAPQRPLPPPTTQSGAIQVAPTGSQGQPLQRVDQIRSERREVTEGGRTFIREPDRTIIREDGRTIIRHNEVDRFRFDARDVRSERNGGETTTIIDRPDGTRIVTVVDAEGRLVRRSRRGPDGRDVILIENSYRGPSQSYYVELPPPVVRIPRERYILETEHANQRDIYEVLTAPPVERIDRRYTLDEIRYSPRVRERMPRVDIDTINFESGSWAITPDQIDRLAVIAEAVKQAIGRNPAEIYLVEGHTDAVGSDEDNLSLSDRRAESVAVALTQHFGVPAENLTTQGYGEQYLKVPTQDAERQNRRVTLRRITPLLTGQN